MQALIVLTLSFGLLWVLFLLPQKRRLKAHQELVASLEVGDEVLLTAGIYGRITALDDEDEEARVEVAPGIELRVARRAVLRRTTDAPSGAAGAAGATGGGSGSAVTSALSPFTSPMSDSDRD
jgi:preprotein translocase subunit YajC